jgi:hypothetical protein
MEHSSTGQSTGIKRNAVLNRRNKIYYIPDTSEAIWKRKYKEWFRSFKPVPFFPEDIQPQWENKKPSTCGENGG